MYHYQDEALVYAPREQLFSRFRTTKHLPQILPDWLAITADNPAQPVGEGDLLHYHLRIHGIPFHWTTRIEEWNPPHRFVDKQVRGPYKSWTYEHLFFAQSKKSTMTIDTIHYEVPGGFLEWFVQRVAEHELKRIFDHRGQRLRTLYPCRR